nr:hypothetical protein [Devosia pacifica]
MPPAFRSRFLVVVSTAEALQVRRIKSPLRRQADRCDVVDVNSNLDNLTGQALNAKR